MALNENLVIRLSADTSNYTTKLAAASRQAEHLSESLEKPRSTGQKVDKVLTNVGVAAGAVAVAVGVSAVRAFMDFDKSMSAVSANTSASVSVMNDLKNAALDAGARTVYSATESADAINELAKAGMSTEDILNGGLNGALDLAASGQMGVADAAELSASALNEFGLSGDYASHVADLLAAGANTAQGSVADMGGALNMVGTTAAQLGMSMDDTVGALTALASKGITGSQAGEQLRSALIGLTSASGPVKRKMEELGLSMYDNQGNFVGLSNFAGQLKDKLAALTPEQRANAMGVLFSNAAMNAGNVLYEQGAEGMEEFSRQVNKTGFAQEQAAALTNNLAGDLEQLGGAFETSFIKIGEGANGPLRSLIQTITNVVNAFGDLDPKIQQYTVLALGAVGAGAGLHKVFGPLQNSTSGLSKAFSLAVDPVQRLQKGFGGFLSAATTLKTLGNTNAQIDLFGQTMSNSSIKTTAAGQALGGVVGLLGGPLGIALTGAGIAVGIFAKEQQEAKAHTDALASSLQKGSDAAAVLVEDLKQDAGVKFDWWHGGMGLDNLKDALDQVGISYDVMASAAMGSKSAIQEINDMVSRETNTDPNYAGQVSARARKVQEALTNQTKAYKESQEAAEAEAIVKEKTTSANVDATLATAGLTSATEEAAEATGEVSEASDILEQRLGATTKGVNDQANALGEVISALDTYYGFAQSAYDADTDLAEAFDKANQSIIDNGATLDTNTDKGRANRDALSSLADSVTAAAEAHARNGESLEAVNGIMNDGRQKVIDMATAMGMSSEEAAALADEWGLSQEAVDSLVDSVSGADDLKIEIKDAATKTLESINLAVEKLPDGKKVKITGENKDAMEKIAAVTGAKIDDKEGTLTLDKEQFDISMAIANGAYVDPKTGILYGDNNPLLAELAEANGWTIDPKTGEIKGNHAPLRAGLDAVKAWPVDFKKTVLIDGDDSALQSLLTRIRGGSAAPGTLTYRPGVSLPRATGGYIRGPGTATSDSIPARLSNGEYVIRAAAVKSIGREYLDRLNAQGYAAGGYVQAPRVEAATKLGGPMVTTNGEVTRMIADAVVSLHRDLPSIIATSTPVMGETDLARATRKALR